MTVPKYDFMEDAIGVGIDQILKDQDGNDVILDAVNDSVTFRWWFEGDATAMERTATIVGSPSNVVRYVTQANDLQAGRMNALFVIDAPTKPFNGPTEPQTYLVGAANPDS